jgi:autotransporter-associated beta strand protein
LSGTNTYIGATQIKRGTLALGSAGGVPALSAVFLATGVNAIFDLMGSNATIGSLAGGGTVMLNGGTLTTGGNGNSTTFNGMIAAPGGLTKIGGGIFTLGGTNSYAGPTQVNGGVLRVNGMQTFSPVTVNGLNRLATLGGSGTVASIAATGPNDLVIPGSGSPFGTLTSLADVTLNSTTLFQVRLGKDTTGLKSDLLQVMSGPVTLNNALLSVPPPMFSLAPRVPDTFTILSSSGSPISGLFQGLHVDAKGGVSVGVLIEGDTFVVPQGGMNHFFTIHYNSGGSNVLLTFSKTTSSVENLTVIPSAVKEGDAVTLTGKLTHPDPNIVLNLRIDWGGGNVEIFENVGQNPFAHSHTYQDPGDYTMLVSWFDEQGDGNSRELQVTVNNVAPTISAAGDLMLALGDDLQRTGSFTDPGKDESYSATVDYGDGSGAQPLPLNEDRTFDLSHSYKVAGTYQVVVTVADNNGGAGTADFTVTVAGGGAASPPPRSEGGPQADLFALQTQTPALFGPQSLWIPARDETQRTSDDRVPGSLTTANVERFFRQIGNEDATGAIGKFFRTRPQMGAVGLDQARGIPLPAHLLLRRSCPLLGSFGVLTFPGGLSLGIRCQLALRCRFALGTRRPQRLPSTDDNSSHQEQHEHRGDGHRQPIFAGEFAQPITRRGRGGLHRLIV